MANFLDLLEIYKQLGNDVSEGFGKYKEGIDSENSILGKIRAATIDPLAAIPGAPIRELEDSLGVPFSTDSISNIDYIDPRAALDRTNQAIEETKTLERAKQASEVDQLFKSLKNASGKNTKVFASVGNEVRGSDGTGAYSKVGNKKEQLRSTLSDQEQLLEAVASGNTELIAAVQLMRELSGSNNELNSLIEIAKGDDSGRLREILSAMLLGSLNRDEAGSIILNKITKNKKA